MQDDPLRRLRPPTAPPALRARVLAAANRAGDRPPLAAWERAVDRLWASWPLRLAWAATVLALLAGHLVEGAVAVQPSPPKARVVSIDGVGEIELLRRRRPSPSPAFPFAAVSQTVREIPL